MEFNVMDQKCCIYNFIIIMAERKIEMKQKIDIMIKLPENDIARVARSTVSHLSS